MSSLIEHREVAGRLRLAAMGYLVCGTLWLAVCIATTALWFTYIAPVALIAVGWRRINAYRGERDDAEGRHGSDDYGRDDAPRASIG